jgi:aspartate/methionine/tyrosine aminotransferase
MVPLPVQQAMITALSDEKHVKEQADRYRNRRQMLKQALLSKGFKIEYSQAGLYIWCTKGEDGYKTVDYFAELGILVTPGAFYGSDNYVRIALTATDENIKQVADRISR